MKETVCAITGAIGGCVSGLLGGWTAALTTLCIFMVIDYLTGLIVAGVFHASPKTESGALESRAGLKGLMRKGMMLLIVLMGYRLDLASGLNMIKDGVCIAFILNEVLSITENAGLMGIPIPAVITKAIDILSKPAAEEPAQKTD